jgi:CheY-like chemotaxis protein
MSFQGTATAVDRAIVLPLSTSETRSTPFPHPRLPMDSGASPHVLVVDDAPQVRDLFGRFLTMAGMAVTVAEDGVLGLAQARVRVPDVVVCDLEMPNMGGLTLCRALRDDRATKHVPILVVSGSASTQARAALDAGCDAVLAKPCSGALLVETIRGLLDPAR